MRGWAEGLSFLFQPSEPAAPSTVRRLASDLPADFFPGLTGWVKREHSPEPRHAFSVSTLLQLFPHRKGSQLLLLWKVAPALPIPAAPTVKWSRWPRTYFVQSLKKNFFSLRGKIHLKDTIRCAFAYSSVVKLSPYLIPARSHHPKGNPVPISSHSPLPPPLPPSPPPPAPGNH